MIKRLCDVSKIFLVAVLIFSTMDTVTPISATNEEQIQDTIVSYEVTYNQEKSKATILFDIESWVPTIAYS